MLKKITLIVAGFTLGNFAYGSVCNTGGHVFSNLRVEQCTGTYCRDTNKGCVPVTATAFATDIGCY